MKSLFSVWLVPDTKDKFYLENIVKSLSLKNSSSNFIPHLTLFADIEIELNELKNIVDIVFKDSHKFNIQKTKVSHSELFFKTVFIEFELNEKLRDLYLKLSSKTDKRSLDDFKPHISLIYKNMPEKEKLQIIKALDIKDNFTIGSVYINAPKNGEKDFLNVLGWQTVYKKELI